jgi:hypothetical protein
MCEYGPCNGTSGSGPVGGGEGGGKSSKKRGRGLGTIKSDDERTDDSENAGETPRGGGRVKMPSDGAERGDGERKDRDADGADMGNALRQTGGTGEGGPGLGLASRVSGMMNFGRGGGSSEVIMTAGEDGVGIMPSGESKRVEGVKRTREVAGADAGGCS